MTDMHREAFERWFALYFHVTNDAANDGEAWAVKTRHYLDIGWCAAIRHLTEQNEQRDSHE